MVAVGETEALKPIHNPVAMPSEGETQTLSGVLAALTSTSHLERDRALTHFNDLLPTTSPTDLEQAQTHILSQLKSTEAWYTIHSATTAAQTLLTHAAPQEDSPFIESLQAACKTLILNTEARVRDGASKLIGVLATVAPKSTLRALLLPLLEQADSNFSLSEEERLSEAARVASRDANATAGSTKLGRKLVHETEGWRTLESSLLALSALVRSSGSLAFPHPQTHDLLHGTASQFTKLVLRASQHANRFVREAGLKLLDATCTSAITADAERGTNGHELLVRIGTDCLPPLREGLCDNWSQVRYAASLATRTLLMPLSSGDRTPLLHSLLPPMCLNRHYVAEGVRAYSQATWKSVLQTEGRVQLTAHLSQVITFYEGQITADNHAVREAACQSLGELVLRLERAAIAPFARGIATALVNAFKDESWPVRDHACRALADVVSTFPERMDEMADGNTKLETDGTEAALLPEMKQLFSRHLSDNIPSVRENCARGFVQVCLAFDSTHAYMGDAALTDVIATALASISTQKEDGSHNDGGHNNNNNGNKTTNEQSGSGTTTAVMADTQFGASTKLAGRNLVEDALHTNQVMYSCGSLAPKLRRGGGCSDHGFTRPREAWEIAEGGLLTLRALLPHGERGSAICKQLLSNVVDAGVKGMELKFRQGGKFVQAVCAALSEIVQGLPTMGEDDVVLEELVQVVVMAQRGYGVTARKVAAECQRGVLRKVGLRRFAELEEKVKARCDIGK